MGSALKIGAPILERGVQEIQKQRQREKNLKKLEKLIVLLWTLDICAATGFCVWATLNTLWNGHLDIGLILFPTLWVVSSGLLFCFCDDNQSKDNISSGWCLLAFYIWTIPHTILTCSYVVASEFLFFVLMESMTAMKARKSKICSVIARQLHVEDNGQQTAEQVVGNMIHPLLQQQWDHYLRDRMENTFGIEIEAIDIEIDGVFEGVVGREEYSKWEFLRKQCRRGLRVYISKCIEICWVMILMKPQLSFHPTSFRAVYDDKRGGSEYHLSEKHHLWTGSKTQEGAKTVYFSVPAIMQGHLLQKDKGLQVVPGQLFVHNDSELVEYIMSDPEAIMNRE